MANKTFTFCYAIVVIDFLKQQYTMYSPTELATLLFPAKV